MTQPYLPRDEAGRLIWLTNFTPKFSSTYYNTLGFVTADAISVTNDLAFYTFIVNFKAALKSKSSDWTAYTKLGSDGASGVSAMGAFPVMPTLPATPPTIVAPDIFGRIAVLVGRLKKHPAYTPAIGQDLGVIGSEDTFNAGSAKPIVTIELQSGRPNLKWTKGAMQGIDFFVDRGSGTFVFLARDTEPDYLDTGALPAAGQTALWKYKAIYVLHDEQVGLWSDVMSQAVLGN